MLLSSSDYSFQPTVGVFDISVCLEQVKSRDRNGVTVTGVLHQTSVLISQIDVLLPLLFCACKANQNVLIFNAYSCLTLNQCIDPLRGWDGKIWDIKVKSVSQIFAFIK